MNSPVVDDKISGYSFRKSLTEIRERIYSSLSTYFKLTIFPVTFLLVGLGAFLLHAFTINRINQVTEYSLIGIADTYEDILFPSLMINDTLLLQRAVFNIGNQNQARAVRLLNQDGEVVASSVVDETGIVLDRNKASCQVCHTSHGSQNPMTEIRSLNDNAQKVILVANPIENRISCQSCHGEDRQTLGLLLVEFPRGQFEDWRTLLDIGIFAGAFVLATLISVVIYSLLSSNFIQPIKKLTNLWASELPISGENEIEQVSRHIKGVLKELDQKDKELAIEHHKIDHLFSLQFNTDNPPSLEKFFQESLRIIQDITGFSNITLRLYDPGTQSFRIMAQRGMTPEMLADLSVLPASAGFHAEIIQTHKPVFTSDLPHDPRLSSSAPISAGYRSLACIPLLNQDILVGSMQLVTKEEYIWSENEQRWFGLIGRRIGLLIQQIQLSERLRDLAILEERSRISQEIHDGLAQLVGSLRIWSEEALACLEDRELDDVRKALEKIEGTSGDAYASLREEMLGLRETIFPQKELSTFLSECLRRFQRQWGIQTELQVEKCGEGLDSWSIAPAAEIQLLRIFQEGLTNVRRHANASLIIVVLSCTDGWLILRVQDNGTGFDLGNIPDDRLGLRIMRERATSAGGAIAIRSQIGQGTQLEIKIPIRIFKSPD
jgi:signal transduction histidine kinase